MELKETLETMLYFLVIPVCIAIGLAVCVVVINFLTKNDDKEV